MLKHFYPKNKHIIFILRRYPDVSVGVDNVDGIVGAVAVGAEPGVVAGHSVGAGRGFGDVGD